MNKEDLEIATGVSARNVRYLVSEGILPPPEGTGRSARYTEEHLRILRVYSEAKIEGITSLEVIRRRVAADLAAPAKDDGTSMLVEVMDGLSVQIDPAKLVGVQLDDILVALRTTLEANLNLKKD